MTRGPLFGIALKLASTLAFALMGVLVKLLGEQFHAVQLIFFRSAFALIPVLAMLAWHGGGWRDLKTRRPAAHALRSAAGTAAMFFGFSALVLLPLADATAISFAAPILTVVLAVVILRETVRLYRWVAVFGGLIGVLVMIWPHLGAQGGSSLGAVLALISAVCSAFAMIFIRRMSVPGEGQESATVIAFYFQATAAVAALCVLPWVWSPPGVLELALLIGIGLSGGAGQLLMTHGYAYAHASTIAPLDYVAMVWAVALGWLVFGDWPMPLVWRGSAIVVAAGLFIIWREHRLGRDKARLSVE